MAKKDVSDLGPVDYSNSEPPAKYKCSTCGAHGVKLWREYQTFLDNQSLLCGSCACKEQSKEGKTFTIEAKEGGKLYITHYPDPYEFSGSGDQIGWRIPAVPTKEGDTYWGYTSVPQDGCDWWNRLPLEKK